jgi:cardiolipin synthase
VSRFRPLNPFTLVRATRRDHRRAIVVDGRVAFTGGDAIANKWLGNDARHWRDNMVRVTGPLAAGVQAAFVENWVYATGEVLSGSRMFPGGGRPAERAARAAGGLYPAAIALVSSPSETAQPIRLLYWLSFRAARGRIYVSNSYFVPSRAMREQLEAWERVKERLSALLIEQY